MRRSDSQGALVLRGPARLTIAGKSVRLRKKGLALLSFIAVEGPTRRERLAELLWGHGQALQNLRVEIHRLRRTLTDLGVDPFKPQTDPLELSDDVAAIYGDGALLEGLDDISPEFQDWLEQRRAVQEGNGESNFREALLDDLVGLLSPPFVVVVAGLPGSGRRAFAKALARRIGLPFVEGEQRSGGAVRYVVPGEQVAASLAAHIVDDESSVWVVERSLFGEDPDLVLQLRSRVPASRLKFVELPPLNWWDVKRSLPQGVDFVEGARLFLASGGNLQYLQELLDLRTHVGPQSDLPVPLRMRAAMMLETRELSLAARRALESASVHRGDFTTEALEAVGAADHLDELERSGWIVFHGGRWRFASELARRLIEDQLQEGVRRRSHLLLAAQFAREGASVAAEYHKCRGAGSTPRPLELVRSVSRSEAPRVELVGVGPEVWLDDGVASGCSVRIEGDKLVWSRGAASGDESSVLYALEKREILLRVRGRALVVDGSARDFAGPVGALTISLPGAAVADVHLCGVTQAEMADGRTLRLPLSHRFDHWLIAPVAGCLRLTSRAASAVIEMRINAYRPKSVPAKAGEDFAKVEAYQLEQIGDDFEQDAWRGPNGPDLRGPALVVQS